jgi:hypothetical protein
MMALEFTKPSILNPKNTRGGQGDEMDQFGIGFAARFCIWLRSDGYGREKS